MRGWVGLLLAACQGERTCPPGREGSAENVLIILSDDVGIDKTGAYGEHDSAPPTPNIDALAERGLLFRNAYATPTCSPTRAALLTGRLPSRTGIGRWIYPTGGDADLRLGELSVAEMLRHAPVCTTSGWVGKWHMVDFDRPQAEDHPRDQGFDRFAGSLGNPLDAVRWGHKPRGYTQWEKCADGELSWSDTYMASDTTDEALAFLRTAPEPWFLVVAYNLAHVPVHVPPAALNLAGVTEDSDDLDKMEAMVSAMDAEIGRLLAGLPTVVNDRTNIVYLSDNGTARDFIEEPWLRGRGKETIFDGGVRVPFLVAGPHVSRPGAETDALVSVVDIFPTIAEIAGVDVDLLEGESFDAEGRPVVLDGTSFLSVLEDPDAPGPRNEVYTEAFYPNGDVDRAWHSRMIRNAGWKYARYEEQGVPIYEQLYRYDPENTDEGDDLISRGLSAEDQAQYEGLSAAMDELVAGLAFGY